MGNLHFKAPTIRIISLQLQFVAFFVVKQLLSKNATTEEEEEDYH